MSKQILPPSFKHALSQGFAPLGQFVASLLQAMGRGAARIVRSMDALASRIMKTADKHAEEREFRQFS